MKNSHHSATNFLRRSFPVSLPWRTDFGNWMHLMQPLKALLPVTTPDLGMIDQLGQGDTALESFRPDSFYTCGDGQRI